MGSILIISLQTGLRGNSDCFFELVLDCCVFLLPPDVSATTVSLTGEEQLLSAAGACCPDGDSILLATAVDIDPADEEATEAGVMDRRGGGGRAAAAVEEPPFAP